MMNRNMSSDNDTQKRKHLRNDDLMLQTTPVSIENPNPPPRKDRIDDSSRGDSRHSSGKNSGGGGDSSSTCQSQGNQVGSPSTTHSGGSSSHTYANPLRFLYL